MAGVWRVVVRPTAEWQPIKLAALESLLTADGAILNPTRRKKSQRNHILIRKHSVHRIITNKLLNGEINYILSKSTFPFLRFSCGLQFHLRPREQYFLLHNLVLNEIWTKSWKHDHIKMQMLYNMMNGNFLVVGGREWRGTAQHKILTARLFFIRYDHWISVML